MSLPALTRRRVLRNAALGTASLLSAPYVRAQYSAGKLQIGAWDHSVPAANEMFTRLCQAWAETNHVEVKIDFLTSTLMASARLKPEKGTTSSRIPPGRSSSTATCSNRSTTS